MTAGLSAGQFWRRWLWPGAAVLVFALCEFQPAILRQAQVLSLPRLKMPLEPSDTDITLYLTLTRHWLAGLFSGGFFDHAVHNTNAPFHGFVAHWTRPMQFLLLLAYGLTPARFGTDIRLLLGANWLPVVMCLAALPLLAGAARRHFRHAGVWALAAMLMLLDPEVGKNFAPGNADHHGFLCLLFCGALFLLLDESLSLAGACALGAVTGVMMWIGIEGLAIVGLFVGLLGAEALVRPGRMKHAAMAATGAAAMTTLALFIEFPPSRILGEQHYDALSVVHAFLFGLTALGCWALVPLFSPARARPLSPVCRVLAAAAAGLGVLLGMAAVFPKFYGGVLVDADPFISQTFFPSVTEMMPLFTVANQEIMIQLAAPAVALLLLLLSRPWRPMRAAKRRYLLLLCGLLLVTFGLTAMSNRWSYYMHPAAIVVIAALAPGIGTGAKKFWSWLRVLPRVVRPYFWPGLVYTIGAFAPLFFPAGPTDLQWCMTQMRYVIDSGQLQTKLGDKPLNLYVPSNEAGDVLFFTPYHVIATNLHREGAQLQYLRYIEAAPDPATLENLLRKKQVDAMFFCPARTPPTTWLRKMGDPDTKPLPWAEPLTGLRFVEGIDSSHPLLLRLKEPHDARHKP